MSDFFLSHVRRACARAPKEQNQSIDQSICAESTSLIMRDYESTEKLAIVHMNEAIIQSSKSHHDVNPGTSKPEKAKTALPDSLKSILIHALRGAFRSFILAYGLRSGLLMLLKMSAVFRGKSSLRSVIVESMTNRECHQYGMAVGGFSFTWKLVNNCLRIYRLNNSRMNGAISGGLAALSLIWLPSSTRKSFSVQMMLRACQLLYNHNKHAGRLNLPHGDLVLFALSCGSIMYAFILRPSTIPRSYYWWMVQASGAHPAVLDANRKLVRSQGRWLEGDAYDLVRLCQSLGASGEAVADCRRTIEQCPVNGLAIPCSLIHCRDIGCVRNNSMLFMRVVWKMIPVNLALNVVPQALLKFSSFSKQPLQSLQKSARISLQSSVFLGAFISLFQSMICLQRRLILPRPKFAAWLGQPGGHKLWYWAAGVISSSLSLLIEQKRRRGELALYVFPKAMESLYYTMLDRKSLKRPLPSGCEMVLSICAFSVLMAWYQDQQGSEHMSPAVRGVMRRLIGEN